MNPLEALVIGTVVVGSTMSPQPKYDESATCLAKNMYYEARNQGTAGWMAVTAVVLNRVNDDRFPNSVCEVVQEGPTRKSWQDSNVRIPIKHRCQFSWFCDGKSDKPKDKKTYNDMLGLADAILSNELPFYDITDGATHYHADYVTPAWAKTKTMTVEIGDHIFYKWEK
jgi:spore germination cell wall hydrolase CwlJ-like protein